MWPSRHRDRSGNIGYPKGWPSVSEVALSPNPTLASSSGGTIGILSKKAIRSIRMMAAGYSQADAHIRSDNNGCEAACTLSAGVPIFNEKGPSDDVRGGLVRKLHRPVVKNAADSMYSLHQHIARRHVNQLGLRSSGHKKPSCVGQKGNTELVPINRPRGTTWDSENNRIYWLPLHPNLRAFPKETFQWHTSEFRPRLQLRGSAGLAPASPELFSYSNQNISHRLLLWSSNVNVFLFISVSFQLRAEKDTAGQASSGTRGSLAPCN